MTSRTRFLSALTLVLLATAPLLANEEAAADPGWGPAIAKFINFAILATVVGYFAKGPFGAYLSTRSSTIKKDLVDAKTLRAQAEQQLADVRQRLAKLPGELAELKQRGEEELAAEKVRLASATAAERQRLLEQTRREIALQSRLARRELVEHGIDLSMTLAKQRIQSSITSEDQTRLIDRYATGVQA